MTTAEQLTEDAQTILVAIPDPNYDRIEEDHEWTAAFEATRVALEREVGLSFEEADIGPGASLPAFVTLLPIAGPAAIVVALFFAGKPIDENLTAWSEIARKLRSLFKREVRLNRQGAAAIAIEALMDHLEGLPKTLHLHGYRPVSLMDDDALEAHAEPEIMDAPATLFLGFVRHDFDIEADGVRYRVVVDGTNTVISDGARLGSTRKKI